MSFISTIPFMLKVIKLSYEKETKSILRLSKFSQFMATSLSTRMLENKVAIITGSNSGIGEGIATEFIHQGACVTLNGRDTELLQAVEKKCVQLTGDRRKILAVSGDVTLEDVRYRLIQDTVNYFDKLDILVNNAGSFQGKALSDDLEISRLDAMLNIHTRTPFHLTKIAIPHLIKTKGNIINISSIGGINTISNEVVEYGMAKAALIQLTRYTALELGPKGVRANVICPGIIDTPIFLKGGAKQEDVQKMLEGYAKMHALQRYGHTDDIAKVAAFLASDGASFVTGITMPVDGGIMLTPPSGFQR